MTTALREIQYLVLPNADEPFLLARVRWPDVYQAISAVRPDWQDDPGLFDLPYAANSTRLTREEAERVATAWGARLPGEDEAQLKGPSLIRRMPSDWSKLSTAERRAWSIPAGKATRRAPIAAFATFERPAGYVPPVPKSRRWRRRAAVATSMPPVPYPDGSPAESQHIDLPEPRESADGSVEAVSIHEPTASVPAADHSPTSLVMNLTTGTWHVDPVTGEDTSSADDGGQDDSHGAPLSIDLTSPATKRLRRGRRNTKGTKAAEEATPAVIDLTDDKESADSGADLA